MTRRAKEAKLPSPYFAERARTGGKRQGKSQTESLKGRRWLKTPMSRKRNSRNLGNNFPRHFLAQARFPLVVRGRTDSAVDCQFMKRFSLSAAAATFLPPFGTIHKGRPEFFGILDPLRIRE